jgi:uncharacterized protein YecE (DUF72 family)
VTHRDRLAHAAEDLAAFQRSCGVLGERLGPVLYQLPPNFPKDLARLLEFLELLPGSRQAAFEFRHPSWFTHDVFRALRNHKAALCLAESETLTTPFEVTATFGYLRLRREGYGPQQLENWASRVRSLPWKEAYVYFKHEDEARGTALASAFREMMAPAGRKG